MAANKVSFEAHHGATVTTTLPGGQILRLAPGDSYQTSDLGEIEHLNSSPGVKKAEKQAKE